MEYLAFKRNGLGRGYSSAAKHFPDKHKTLSSTPLSKTTPPTTKTLKGVDFLYMIQFRRTLQICQISAHFSSTCTRNMPSEMIQTQKKRYCMFPPI